MNDAVKPLPSVPRESQDIPQDEQRRRQSQTSGRSDRNTNTGVQKQRGYNDHKILYDEKVFEEEPEDDEYEFFQHFEREKVKGVIHQITSALKERGIDTEYLMIPFRPEQTNEKLLRFLNQMFPMGNGQPVSEKLQIRIIGKTEVWTLFQGLKYIWCRLPNAEIVGWKSYLEFKYREADKNYPQKAFLEIMPQCLESANHASIVYDFFDLIVTLASNASVNKLSARKISKMCAVWAFSKPLDIEGNPLQNYDFDCRKSGSSSVRKVNNSFQDGLDEWIPASDAMFHLLLSFLRSFVPKDLDSSVLPRSLKSVLFNNEYPPKQSTAYNSETILTIPSVTLNTDKFSRKPWQLLERCNELLDFSDYDAFEAREDYALLKSLFKKKNNIEGISRKMSQESRRLMKLLSTKHSTFQAGWARRKCLENVQELKEYIKVKRVDIDDYFIWAWLSTLSYEETPDKRKIFGRSLILEFEFDGFKKWVLFQESDIVLNYNRRSQLKNKRKQEEKMSRRNSALSPNSFSPKLASPTENSFPLGSPEFPPGFASERHGSYHTIITKEALQKNSGKSGKQGGTESKMSRWNPLNTLKKKSSNNLGKSPVIGTPELSDGGRFSKESDRSVSGVSSHRLPSDGALLSSKHLQLPPIDVGESFTVDIPEFEYSDADTSIAAQASANVDSSIAISGTTLRPSEQQENVQRRTTSVAQEMEELSQMVEHMMGDQVGKKQINLTTGLHTPEIKVGVHGRTKHPDAPQDTRPSIPDSSTMVTSRKYGVPKATTDNLSPEKNHWSRPQGTEPLANVAPEENQLPRIPKRPMGRTKKKKSEEETNINGDIHQKTSHDESRIYPQRMAEESPREKIPPGRPESIEILPVRLSGPYSHRSAAQSEQGLREQVTSTSSSHHTHLHNAKVNEYTVSQSPQTITTSETTNVPLPKESKAAQEDHFTHIPSLPPSDHNQRELPSDKNSKRVNAGRDHYRATSPVRSLKDPGSDTQRINRQAINNDKSSSNNDSSIIDNANRQRHISPVRYEGAPSPKKPLQVVAEGPHKPSQRPGDRRKSHEFQGRPENLAAQIQIDLQPQPQLQQQIRSQQHYQEGNHEYHDYYHAPQQMNMQYSPQMGADMYGGDMDMGDTYADPYSQRGMNPQGGYYYNQNEYYSPNEQIQRQVQVATVPPQQERQQRQKMPERSHQHQNPKPRAPSPLRQNMYGYQQMPSKPQQQQPQPYTTSYSQQAYMPPPVAPFNGAAGPNSSPNLNVNPQMYGSSLPVFGPQGGLPPGPMPAQPQMVPRYAMKQTTGGNYMNVNVPQVQITIPGPAVGPGPGHRAPGGMQGIPVSAPTIPITAPHATGFNRLHGNANKKLERRQLYDELRTGNFGI